MTGLSHLWRHQRAALLAFTAAVLITLVFAIRLGVLAVYWSDPARRDLHPEIWMTPGYVARSWHVPRDALARELRVEPAPGVARTLAEIAAARGTDPAAFLAEVEAALARLRAADQGG